jgi:hypothetical protein
MNQIIKNISHLQNKEAFDYYQKLVFLRRKQGEVALEIGRVLKEIKEKKLYRYLGEGGYDDFFQFLSDPEISMNYNTASLYIRVYEFYVEQLKLNPDELASIPINRLNTLKSKLEKTENKEEIEEWLEKAKTLGRLDFEKETEEAKITKPRPIVLTRCKKCGKIKIVINLPDEICQCR